MAASNMTSMLPGSELAGIYEQALAQHQQGHFARAEALYQQVLALVPEHANALHRLGQIQFQSGRVKSATELLERAIRLQPNNAAAHSDLGVMHRSLLHYSLASACFESAVRLDPSQASAWNNLGNSLQKQGDHHQALACFERATTLRPKFAEAYYNRGNALQALQRHDAAIASYAQAIRLRPDYPEALSNRSTSLGALKHHDKALASCDAALRLRPGFIDAINNRARTLQQMNRMEEAAAAFSYLLELQPDHPLAHSRVLHYQLKKCDWSNYHKNVDMIVRGVAEGKDADSPFGFLSICDSPELQRQCASTRMSIDCPDIGVNMWRTHGERAARSTSGKLRLAYLSSDFRNHPLASLVPELFELHDRSRFEVIGICFGPNDNGPARKRIEAGLDSCINIDALEDRQAARVLCELGIDIAIDLNGLTAHGRTGILALRPAPVQVSYMGFPGTLGAQYIDYILADAHVIPPDQHQHYSESVVTLPDCYQVNDRQRRIAERTPSRAELGLPEAGFVFCCFNSNNKMSPAMFDVWMELLQDIEGSVLWLQHSHADVPGNLCREARARGIDPGRLIFKRALPMADHLACYRRADLFLDTLPYNAHTTASDALWAGLPVLTCMGNSFASRVAGSLLHATGLPELVTHSVPEYQATARRLARDPQLLAALRHKLSRNRDTCPLFDTPRFCRHIESAYTTMWQRHLRGERPTGITVPVIAGSGSDP